MSETITLTEMNALAEEITLLRDKEKELSDAKKLVTEELEAKESLAAELLIQNQLTSYRSPAGTLSLTFRTSVRQPQGEQVPQWIEHLTKEYGTLSGAIQAGMLTTNSMKLNAYVKEKMELAREAGGEVNLTEWGLTEPKVNPTLSFRRTR